MSKESENSAKGWKKLRKKKDLEVAKGYRVNFKIGKIGWMFYFSRVSIFLTSL